MFLKCSLLEGSAENGARKAVHVESVKTFKSS